MCCVARHPLQNWVMRLLLVEDNARLSDLIAGGLAKEGLPWIPLALWRSA